MAFAWSAWEDLGRPSVDGSASGLVEIAAVSMQDARIDVVGVTHHSAPGGKVTTDRGLWHLAYDDSKPGASAGWMKWRRLAEGRAELPSLASWAPGRLDAAFRLDNKPVHMYFNGTWHKPATDEVDGSLSGRIAITSQGEGTLDYFAVHGGLKQGWYDPGSGWSSPLPIDSLDPLVMGYGVAPLAATSWAAGRFDVFTLDVNGDVRHVWYERRWSNGTPEVLGRPGTAKPHGYDVAAVSPVAGRIHLFKLADRTTVGMKSYLEGWSGWSSLPGLASGLPGRQFRGTNLAVAAWSPDRLDVFGVDNDGHLLHAWGVNS
jgi:hypothetical protein